MALCHSLMFLVVVGINFTPGLSKQIYSLSVNSTLYDDGRTVDVEEDTYINITCDFSGGRPLPDFTRVSCFNHSKSQDKHAPSATLIFNVNVTMSLKKPTCHCVGTVSGEWSDRTTVTLNVKRNHSRSNRTMTRSKTTPGPIKETSQGTKNKQNGAGSKPKTARPTADTKIEKASTSRTRTHSKTSPGPIKETNGGTRNEQNGEGSEPMTTKPTADKISNASTPRKPKPVQVESNNDLLVIIVPASVCVVLALVVTLVIVVLVLRRKTATRNIQDKGEATYAVVQDVETKRDYIGTNIDETYAVVNKKQKATKKDVGPQDFNPLDETYAVVNKNKKTNNGDTEASTDPVSNPMAQPKGMNFNMATLREEGDGLAVYKNVQKEHGDFSTKDKTKTNSTEGSGRYLNEDGLVYVTVELNPVAPKSTIKPASIVRDERYEPVEYSTIVPGQGAKKDETNDEA